TGLSAYDLWLQLGHEGTAQQFLDSLVGEKGADGIFYGSNGLNGKAGAAGANGASGEDGLSAFQIWLQTNPEGTEQEFLDSLVGPAGTAGIGGLSAYDLWVVTHPGATLEEFIAQLTGTAGTNGTDGLNGQSAYEIWLKDSANTGKSEAEFIASLKGATGDAGICVNGTNGTNGTNGADGLSAYQLWLVADPNHTGTVDTFLASLIGPKGDQGIQGIQGEQGIQGPKGDKGDTGATGATGGYFLSAYDTTVQTAASPANAYPLAVNTVDSSNGITLTTTTNGGGVKHSVITFLHTGTYNIQYSNQWINNISTAKEFNTNVWLRIDGTDLADSSTYTTVGPLHSGVPGALVTSVNYVLHFNAGQTAEFYWWSESSDVQLGTIAAVTSPTLLTPVMPESPSIILTVTQVG
ncbi:MAG: collagen-like protein, partial [Micrococcales bacterium]